MHVADGSKQACGCTVGTHACGPPLHARPGRRRARTWPTRRSPFLVKATTEGVVRPPSALVMMVGLPPSMAATALLVVPRSTPTTCVLVRFVEGWARRACVERSGEARRVGAPALGGRPQRARTNSGRRSGIIRANGQRQEARGSCICGLSGPDGWHHEACFDRPGLCLSPCRSSNCLTFSARTVTCLLRRALGAPRRPEARAAELPRTDLLLRVCMVSAVRRLEN